MTCNDVYLHICDNLDRDLESPECREIKVHLASCPDCQGVLQSLKKTVDLYRAAPTPGVPGPVHERLLNLMDREWSGVRASRKERGK
ncbi:MAG: zf-HC2 domain-containing protein [Ignavibacteria bacterium]|nr:zf-HC2 domain-containing protein [Ignavibacteria bacterium]